MHVRRIYDLRTPEEARRRLRVSITESCNLRCFFCHGDGGGVRHFRNDESPLSSQALAFMVREAAHCGIRKVKLTGGEPLLYHHRGAGIVDLVAKLHEPCEELGVELSLVSNGTLLSLDLAKRLRDVGLRRITISLHTSSDSGFRRYANPQGSPSFSAVLDGIRNAVKAGLDPVKANTVVFASKSNRNLSNVKELRNILKLAGDCGAKEVKFFVVLSSPRQPLAATSDSTVYWDDPIFKEIYPKQFVNAIQSALSNDTLAAHAFPGSFKATFLLGSCGRTFLPAFSFQNLAPRTDLGMLDTLLSHHASRCSCQEGTYALRLLSDGTLIPCLCEGSNLNISEYTARGDDRAVRTIVNLALTRMHDDRMGLSLMPEESLTLDGRADVPACSCV